MGEPLLLDMDGVLLVGPGTDPGVYRMATHDALREFGVRDPDPTHAATLESVHDGDAMASACAALGVDRDDWWAARERHASRRANARVRAGARRLYDDAHAVRELAESHPLGLVSNNRQATVSFVADYCFPSTFDVVVGREPTLVDYANRKPDPTLIERGMNGLGVSSGLYVGDRATDVTAAKRAGLDAVFLKRPHNHDGELDAEPRHVISSLHDLLDLVE